MADRTIAIRDKLDRADEQLDVVKGMVRAYFEADVSHYRGKYEPNPVPGHLTFEAQTPIRPTEVRLAVIVGELVHDLRSALDQLAWQLVLANGGTPTKNTYFPILKKSPTDKQGTRRPPQISGGVSPAALTLIERAQPYWPIFDPPIVTEYQALWVLHRMDIIDKHQQIPIQGQEPDHFVLPASGTCPPFNWTSELVSANEHKADFRIVPDGPTVDMEFGFSVFVVVPEPPGHPCSLVQILSGALSDIRGIVDEARRTCSV